MRNRQRWPRPRANCERYRASIHTSSLTSIPAPAAANQPLTWHVGGGEAGHAEEGARREVGRQRGSEEEVRGHGDQTGPSWTAGDRTGRRESPLGTHSGCMNTHMDEQSYLAEDTTHTLTLSPLNALAWTFLLVSSGSGGEHVLPGGRLSAGCVLLVLHGTLPVALQGGAAQRLDDAGKG